MKRARSTTSRYLVVAMAIVLCISSRAYATSKEYQVKGAFIYNFTQFIEWPKDAFASDDSPFVVAVIGDDPFEGMLEQLMANKMAGNRTIVIKHFALGDDFGRCQIVFIPSTLDDKTHALLDKIGSRPVLSVGETDGVLAAGGTIGLFLEEGRVRFQINPDAIDAAGLKASAKLMKLARIYKK